MKVIIELDFPMVAQSFFLALMMKESYYLLTIFLLFG
nr:MAG TPA: hypothetical protein [Caudoviricetes sp.]